MISCVTVTAAGNEPTHANFPSDQGGARQAVSQGGFTNVVDANT